MKLAILVAAVDPSVGGVLIFGDRGTGKSTAVRALAALLPKMRVVQGCRYGCDPDKPFCKSSGLKNALCDAAKAEKSALVPVVDGVAQVAFPQVPFTTLTPLLQAAQVLL